MQDIGLTLAAMRKWELEGFFVFQCYICPGDKRASHINEDCWKHNFNGNLDLHTSAPFLINTTSHNLTMAY